jgi:hypothetical protein
MSFFNASYGGSSGKSYLLQYIVLAILIISVIGQLLYTQRFIKSMKESRLSVIDRAKKEYTKSLGGLTKENQVRAYGITVLPEHTKTLASILNEYPRFYRSFTSNLKGDFVVTGVCENKPVKAQATVKNINFLVVEHNPSSQKLQQDIQLGLTTCVIINEVLYMVVEGSKEQGEYKSVLNRYNNTFDDKQRLITDNLISSDKIVVIPLIPYSYEFIESELFKQKSGCSLPIINFISPPTTNNLLKHIQGKMYSNTQCEFIVKALELDPGYSSATIKAYVLGFRTNGMFT